MIDIPGMLMIGGNSRHSGKTTLACSLIRKFSADIPVIGLKVTRINPDETSFHGDHTGEADTGWTIFEETDRTGQKDTSQMLLSGASTVYYVRTTDNNLEKAFTDLLSQLGSNSVIICESRSLRKLVKPGLFIVMIRESGEGKSKDISGYLEMADIVCRHGNDSQLMNDLISGIRLTDNRWSVESGQNS